MLGMNHVKEKNNRVSYHTLTVDGLSELSELCIGPSTGQLDDGLVVGQPCLEGAL